MPKKLKLHQHKYFAALKLSKNQQFKLFLLISIYYNATARNIQQLVERVNVFGIPRGWAQQENENQSLIFTTLVTCTTPSASEVVILVKINQSLGIVIEV